MLLMKTKLILTVVLIFSISTLSMAVKPLNPELLKTAWQEYKLGEYSQAEKLFSQAKKLAKDNKNYCEAITGIAFCYQYAKKQQTDADDYRYAIKQYELALKKIGNDSEYRPFLTAMSAECYFKLYKLNGNKNDLNKATERWNEIQQQWPNSIAGQDALLYQVMAMSGDDYSTDEAKKLATKLAAYLKTNRLAPSNANKTAMTNRKKLILAGVMSNYLGDYFFWRKAYRESIKWLINYYELGTSSYSYKADVLYKIARIADVKLNDNTLAIKYYNLFQHEIKSDKRRYFAQQQIISLNKDRKK